MKSFIFILATIILCNACNPKAALLYNLDVVKVNATFNNTNAIINLGDTIKLSVQIPDVLTSSSGNITVQSIQRAQFNLKFNKVDTLTNLSILLYPPLFWTTKGNMNSPNGGDFEFSKGTKPHSVDICFKPQTKGIYFVEVLSQAGIIMVNNGYDGSIVVGFNVPNKHIELASPYFGNAWANEAQTREPGIYVFRVN